MFRIAVSHEDSDHPHAGEFQVGATHTTQQDAEGALEGAEREYPKSDGYRLTVQELVTKGEGEKATATWKEAS